MSHLKSAFLERAVLAVILVGSCRYVHAQSPYGLAARQTIPFVIDYREFEVPVWRTEIDIHNPGSQPLEVRLTYFGAVGTPSPGRLACATQTVGPFATAEFSLGSVCPLTFLSGSINFGRLELNALPEKPGPSDEPGTLVFLSNARASRSGGRYFTVEGFPQGNLSGNKSLAEVTGLKSGLIDGNQWTSRCYAAALNETVTAVVELGDKNGPLGGVAFANLDPSSGTEMWPFVDVFVAVGAPPGNYDNVTASFHTPGGTGGAGGPGVFAFCRVINQSLDKEAFEVAKYVDNNDEARQHITSVNKTAFGQPFRLVSEVRGSDLDTNLSNLHLAYFQHPDEVKCEVHYTCPSKLCTFDLVQMRLIDPDGSVAAGGAHAQSFVLDLGEKAQRYNGRNGPWLIDVGPDRIAKEGDCPSPAAENFGDSHSCLRHGGPHVSPYELTCSSGNGHGQLDVIGHCFMNCTKDQNKEALCAFANQPHCF